MSALRKYFGTAKARIKPVILHEVLVRVLQPVVGNHHGNALLGFLKSIEDIETRTRDLCIHFGKIKNFGLVIQVNFCSAN